jgi:hypothetical protein
MSIGSKAKRDARKKKAAKSAPARPPAEHAHLVDGRGVVFGGAVRRAQEWVLVIGGKPAARTDSAAMVLAMLKHVAELKETAGDAVRLSYSTQLRDAATAEASAEGKTLDEFLAQLEAERAERDATPEPAAAPLESH